MNVRTSALIWLFGSVTGAVLLSGQDDAYKRLDELAKELARAAAISGQASESVAGTTGPQGKASGLPASELEGKRPETAPLQVRFWMGRTPNGRMLLLKFSPNERVDVFVKNLDQWGDPFAGRFTVSSNGDPEVSFDGNTLRFRRSGDSLQLEPTNKEWPTTLTNGIPARISLGVDGWMEKISQQLQPNGNQ